MLNKKISFFSILFSCMLFSLSAQETQSAVTLSVMKFDTMSEKNIDFIGESFADALTTKLTNIKDIRIYERSQFKKITNELQMNVDSSDLFDEDTVQSIGKIVAIDYMTLGSVTLIGNNLRVALRLVDVKTSRAILSKEVEGKYPDDVFDLQDDIALLVVKALNLNISSLEKEQVLRDPTNNMDAYEYYNQSLAEVSGMERVRLLRKALEKDPGFILARHCLAESYFENKNFTASTSVYKKIIDDYPHDFKARYNLGLLWFDLGELEKSADELKKASSLQNDNPDVWYNLALLQEFDKNGNRLSPEVDRIEVKKAYEKVLEVNNKYLEAHYALGVLNALMATEDSDINLQKDYIENAIMHLESYLSIYPDVFNASEVEQNVELLKGSLRQIIDYIGT
ncbi:MAG: tetratricopeptide repeat protein [Spirochaetia bacterium]|jgi:TolB-like protein|nr:tetratricopeptide repeat protein [Spirochaetia bacterium]